MNLEIIRVDLLEMHKNVPSSFKNLNEWGEGGKRRRIVSNQPYDLIPAALWIFSHKLSYRALRRVDDQPSA